MREKIPWCDEDVQIEGYEIHMGETKILRDLPGCLTAIIFVITS